MNILIIIPARGGSQGIPRKNIRSLNNRPLIYYSIKTALESKYNPDVFVTSEDDEILMFAKRFGAATLKRSKSLAKHETTLDPVIYDAWRKIENRKNKSYDYIITLQPTSPLLSVISLDSAIKRMIDNKETDVIISVKEKRHLSWKKSKNKFVPNYSERLNRQYLEPVFEEAGAFIICKKNNLQESATRITGKIDLFNLSKKEAIDIDDYDDWALCNFYLKRKKILFILVGNNKVGLGHIYRSIILSYEILDHEIKFLVTKSSKMGYDILKSYHFDVYIQENDNIIDDINYINPHLVINDILDTNADYIKRLKQLNKKVVNFEDLGDGAASADLVINALYPESKKLPNFYFGYKYFCARDEFINTSKKEVEDVKNVLISFGGVDPNNLTEKVLNSIYVYCLNNAIQITVIEGIGYSKHNTLFKYPAITVINNVKNISDYLLKADLIFTSAGRTVYEIACIGTPTIVLAQNKRELTHFFARSRSGFINLGLGKSVDNSKILSTFTNYIKNKERREKYSRKMLSYDIKNGKKRTLNLINKIIDEINENS